MRHAECEVCGCSLDFGEGRLCDECKEASKKENRIKREMDHMILATDFKQIELEELMK